MNTIKVFTEKNTKGIFSVYIDLNDDTLDYNIHGTGNTEQEAIDDFLTAYQAMKQFYKQKQINFTEAKFTFVGSNPTKQTEKTFVKEEITL